jgi:predicted AlkP superfamily pyrophosphatase or phosphodiesterase
MLIRFVIVLSFAAGLQAEHIPVLLVSIDGLRPDAILEADAHGLKIPHLRRMLSDGSYATGVHGVLPTVTYPSHTTLVTGVSPARHGIFSNTTFDPENKNAQGWYWYSSDIKVPTLWDEAGKAGLITANVHWPVTAGARIDFNLAQYWRTNTPDDRKLVRILSTPGLLDLLERDALPYADGGDESVAADERRVDYAVRLIDLKRPGFMTVYLAALDHSEHQYGPFSPEANATLETIDALIGKLQEAAHGQMVVAVVSDHGFLPVTKDVNIFSAFREAGLIEIDEGVHVKSWAATVWPSGGSGAVMINPSAPSGTKERVGALLDKLVKDPDSGVARLLSSDQVHQLGGWPAAEFGVELKPGYTFGLRPNGPLVTESAYRGMHGYVPDRKEMNSTFVIAGPGVAAGKSLGEIDMRDIAPTLAPILGVHLAQAEGRDLFAHPGHALVSK